MNTIANATTADFSTDTAITGTAFFATLLNNMLALLRLSGGANSIDPELLATRIVFE
ncbi:MAG: hypothetical protein M3Y65_14675 [Pseudomonadota bacterium]|nr:hypothetical protein [Pseudomonadota bacterium]